MARFTAPGAAGGSSLRAAEILGARKFVAAVINYVVAGKSGRDEGSQLRDLHLHHNHGKDQKRLQHIGGKHDAQRN
jgi:hypothetical protein